MTTFVLRLAQVADCHELELLEQRILIVSFGVRIVNIVNWQVENCQNGKEERQSLHCLQIEG